MLIVCLNQYYVLFHLISNIRMILSHYPETDCSGSPSKCKTFSVVVLLIGKEVDRKSLLKSPQNRDHLQTNIKSPALQSFAKFIGIVFVCLQVTCWCGTRPKPVYPQTHEWKKWMNEKFIHAFILKNRPKSIWGYNKYVSQST